MSGSDDFTMFLWEPATSKAPLARMTGHMQLINQVPHKRIPKMTVTTCRFLHTHQSRNWIPAHLGCHMPAVIQGFSRVGQRIPPFVLRASAHATPHSTTPQCWQPADLPADPQVQFSPDGRWIVSASFDKALKLWDGLRGTFVATFRGHVGPVYQVAWSSDSRLFVSGSKDSTLKVHWLRHTTCTGHTPCACIVFPRH